MNKRILFSLVALTSLVIVISFSGCLKGSNSSTCNYDPCSYVAPAAEIQAVQSYLTANNITATQHCSGFFYKIEAAGTGIQPTACSNVDAAYIGKFTNGTTFDSSSTPINFNLSGVIRGWTNGIPLIKEGGTIDLYIPPSLGYGSQAYGPIPANSILVFKVNLAAVHS
jgi:FKBP-type peptidyl-prolyl cis-trans isomerase FkpA